MHGRGCHPEAPYGRGFVFYTSKDGFTWDEGILLEEFKASCYYSNNLLLCEPGEKEKLLVQYSELYGGIKKVNVKHLFLTLE